jgi:peptide/nickel transport system substrate-binding protein
MLMSLFNALVQPHPETGELQPHFARQIDVSEDFSTYTIYFREGLKWSDGEPFTTEDVMFWYEDILQNPDLAPIVPLAWRYGDEIAQVEALDDYSIRVTFAGPSPFFRQRLVHLGNPATLLQPKHYLQQFHPNYTDEEELNRRVEQAGYAEWFQLFNAMNLRTMNAPQVVGAPTVNSYVLVEKTSDRRVYERNPYYWKVDTEGNQLPYIDRIDTQIVANREILNGLIISGGVDFAGFDTEIRNFPLYRRYEDQNDYRVLLWNKGTSSDAIYQVNMTHEDEGLREIFQDVRFRRALSLAINREEIGEEIYFGRASPVQYTLLDISRYYKPEYEQAYTEYDLETARALLDEMGLEVNSAGQRLRPDNGQPITFTIEFFDSETPKAPNVELVTEYWNELGLNVSARANSGELQAQRAPANLMDATIWHGDKATDVLFPIAAQFFVPIAPGWEIAVWTEWARWFNTSGREGEEPPDQIKELRGWWDEMLISPDEERIAELADNILASQAENLWVIGTVGRTPHPVVVKNTIGNVPETGYWVWDMLWSAAWDPEQFFFRQ